MVDINDCKAQAIAISMKKSYFVNTAKIPQKPIIRIPKMSIPTTLSAGVGPIPIRHRQRKQEIISGLRTLSSVDISTVRLSINNPTNKIKPIIQRNVLIPHLFNPLFIPPFLKGDTGGFYSNIFSSILSNFCTITSVALSMSSETTFIQCIYRKPFSLSMSIVKVPGVRVMELAK